MDKNDFGLKSPGSLTPVELFWGPDHAFVPEPLPPAWEFPQELWPLLKDASTQLARLDGIGQTLPNPAILLRPMRDREAIRSSEIEGTIATPKQMLLLELDPKEASSENDPINPQREVLNYARALDHATQTDLPLCLRLLKDLHRLLLSGVRGEDKRPGEFRDVMVAIGRRGRFVPPPPTQLMDCLHPFETYINAEATRFDPIVDCLLAHYQFETIHPFRDGNGRVGRLLLSLMLQQKCQLSQSWVHLSEYFEEHREEYYAGLYEISTKGDWHSWIEYGLRGLRDQATTTIERCYRLLKVRDKYGQLIQNAGGAIRLQKIAEEIFGSPFIRIVELQKKLGVSYPTAKKDVQRLVEVGILAELPDLYPATFYAPELYEVAYEGLED